MYGCHKLQILRIAMQLYINIKVERIPIKIVSCVCGNYICASHKYKIGYNFVKIFKQYIKYCF